MTLSKLVNSLSIDLLASDIQADPFPCYTAMRTYSPICRCEPGGIWAISRYEDVKFTLRHPELFSSAGFVDMYQPEWLHQECRRDPFILGQDPPLHSQRRAFVNKAFSSKVINAMEPLMVANANLLIDGIREKSEVEFIADFAYPYAGAMIGHITGTGETQDLQELRHWLELLEQLSSVRPDDSTVAATEAAIRKEAKYFDAVIQDRRLNPRQDLVSALVSTEIDGNSLTSAELRSALDLLITAGLGTTNYTLCNAVLLLSKDKALFATLKSQPELIAAFVEELLRFDPATHCLLRKTVCAVELAGATIPANCLVAVLVGSANRDEQVFENPNQFILNRHNSREHLSFGFGPHVCVGSALARLELRIALQMLLASFDNISTPHHKDLQWINSLTTHGLRLLPVRFS